MDAAATEFGRRFHISADDDHPRRDSESSVSQVPDHLLLSTDLVKLQYSYACI